MYNKPKKADVWMPFGSAMNAWGQANQGKGIPASELTEEMEILYSKAKELVDREEEASKPPVVNVYPNPYRFRANPPLN